MKAVAEAVQFAHDKGIVHRDIKPQNILLDENEQPRVTDFGLAKQVEAPAELTMTGQVIGTPSYMPPEQAAGAIRDIGAVSDVYSLGATLYFLLTGRPPFQTASRAETIRQVIEAEPVAIRRLNPAIPRDLETICLKCFRKELAKRYSTAAALAADLERWLEGKPIVARPVGRRERAWLWCKRRPAVATLSAAVVVILVVGSLVAWERLNAVRAAELVESLATADAAEVAQIIKRLRAYGRWAKPLLATELTQAKDGSAKKLHLSLALVESDASHVEFLYEQLLRADAVKFAIIRDVLAAHKTALTPRLWEVLAGSEADPQQWRLRAAAALAVYDPANAEWTDIAPGVARQLVAVNPADLGLWREALHGAAPALMKPLSEIFVDPAQGELSRSLATAVLADYAKDDVHALAGLLADADADAFGTLFPVLQAQAGGVPELLALLDCRLTPDWRDAPIDPSWAEPAAAARAAIERAHGLLAERWAFCHDLPWDELPRLADALRGGGYRPTRVRPWAAGGKALVAAVWTRDGKPWWLESDLASDQLPAAEAQPAGIDVHANNEGLLPADLAVLPATDLVTERRFTVLWGPPAARGERRRIVTAADENQLAATVAELSQQGFSSQSTIGAWTDSASRRHYLGIWSNHGPPSELRAAYAAPFERLDQPQCDIAVAPAGKLADPLEAYRGKLAQIEELPAAQLHQPQVRLARAVAHYQLGDLEAALADFDVLISINPPIRRELLADALRYHVWTLARVGRDDLARAALASYLELDTVESDRAHTRTVLAAWQGKFDEAQHELEAAAAAAAANADFLYNAACAAALAGQALAASDPQHAKVMVDRALELLEAAADRGYKKNVQQLRVDVDLAGLHGDERFVALLGRLEPPGRYAAVWRADAGFESRLLGPSTAQSHRTAARELESEGYRPIAIAVDEESSVAGLVRIQDAGARQNPGSLASAATMVSSVWQRPLVPGPAKLEFARRRANAAIALLRQRQRASVLAALRGDPIGGLRDADPEPLTQFVHRCRQRAVTAGELLNAIDLADRERQAKTGRERQIEDRVLYGLLLALGEFDMAELPVERRESFVAQLAGWYADDPASGIHGAAGWLLRHWKHHELVNKVDQTPIAYSEHREWFTMRFDMAEEKSGEVAPAERVTTHSKGAFAMTFVVFPAGEYVIGSARDETGRKTDERRHRVRLTRPLALGDREITWEQFDPLSNGRHREAWQKQYALELGPDDPAFGVTWYDALNFCRWLTERAGMKEEDQACPDPKTLDPAQFPPDPNPNAFPGASRNWPVNLDGRGFRLPSEAEWEVACRSGFSTTYSFGNDDRLLGNYGWFFDNSRKWSHAVAQLRPDARGLFDMHGNMWEWCQGWYSDGWYSEYEEGAVDPLGVAQGPMDRVYRGGAWANPTDECRSANRVRGQPGHRAINLGFRVLLVPFSVGLEGESQAGSRSRERATQAQ
ncbi:MAG TPA: SUMF1/EgtB/PvdO family nonheme iron enzyme [Pirellulales bacterium]|nr:SUMF1/EgtB/PvdO family nonheme iron enzyme [Pirellulales bacterium]